MELTYDKMKKFMLDYCKHYSQYANEEATINEMNEYWDSNFYVTAYFQRNDGTYPVIYKNRKEFQKFLIRTHTVFKDSMLVRDIIIDEKIKKVVLLVKIVKINRERNEKFEIDGMGCYQLILDKNENIKIKSLDFFWDAPENIKNLGSKQ